MTLVAIDTSAGAQVGVLHEGVWKVVSEANSRTHAERLTQLLESALAQSELPTDARAAGVETVVVGTGPAPFTGLRAGLVTAQVLARVCSATAYGVGALEILARQYLDMLPSDVGVVVATDARRREVYWAHARALGPDDVQLLASPAVSSAEQVANYIRQQQVSYGGPGCPLYAEQFPSPLGSAGVDVRVAARIAQARLRRGEIQMPVQPQYLRRPDVHMAPSAIASANPSK